MESELVDCESLTRDYNRIIFRLPLALNTMANVPRLVTVSRAVPDFTAIVTRLYLQTSHLRAASILETAYKDRESTV
jgi:hypothetical protein